MRATGGIRCRSMRVGRSIGSIGAHVKLLMLFCLVALLGCEGEIQVESQPTDSKLTDSSCITDSQGHTLCCAKYDWRCYDDIDAHIQKEFHEFLNGIGKLADELESLAEQLPEDPPHGNGTHQHL